MSNLSSLSGGSAPPNISISINGPGQQQQDQQQQQPPSQQAATHHVKKRRNLPGNPDPDAEVIALSPTTLMATNRFVCEVCNKGFQRDQNLQLHRRGHNLPWRLRQRNSSQENTVKKRVYVCPEPSCVHHDPSRALGDLTGIKKHFSRKHGEKKWKCDRCTKRYAVHSDWKAHQKTCGTREYRCDCGTLFSRRDSFITHRAFCDALAEESARVTANRMPDESQQSGNPDSGTAPDGPSGALIATSAEAPSPPAVSQLTGGAPVDTLTMAEVSKPVMIDNLADFAMLQGGPSISSKWVVQAGMAMNPSTSSKGPGLSLCLGTEPPGPGPPGALQMLEGQVLPYSGTPYVIPNPHKAGALGLMGSGANEATNLPGAGSMFATLMSSATGYSGSHGSVASSSDVMARPGSLIGMMSSQFDRGPPDHNFGDAPTQSTLYKHNQPQSASAHLSATALLLKAAQMGATSSNQYLLQNLGHGVAHPTSSMAPHCTRQGSWSGVNSSILSSSLPAYSRGRQIDSSQNGDQNPVSSFGQRNFSEYMMNSISGAGMMGSSMCDMPPLLGGLRGHMQGHDSLLKHHHIEAQRLQPNLMHGMQQQAGVSHSSGMAGIQRGELERERPMLDFLGVGGPSEMVGVGGGMSHTLLQQKGLASITSLPRGIKAEPLFDQSDGTQPRGMGSQRPS